MRLLTWNLNGLDETKLDERTEAAVFLAVTGRTLRQLAAGKQATSAPDVLVFQEVVERTFAAHLRTHLPRAGYALYPTDPPDREVFEVVAVRAPATIALASSVPLDHSLYGRHLHKVDVAGIPGMATSIRVLTAHFDSGVEEGQVRIAETRQTLRAMDERSIFAGDTNLRDAEWTAVCSTSRTPPADAWESVGSPPDLKRTWRIAGRGARFDRIWLGSAFTATDLSAVGAAALPGLPDGPSDHIGLIADLDMVQASGT